MQWRKKKLSKFILLFLRKGELVIKQGENGDCLFFIEEGTLDCFKRFVNFLIIKSPTQLKINSLRNTNQEKPLENWLYYTMPLELLLAYAKPIAFCGFWIENALTIS